MACVCLESTTIPLGSTSGRALYRGQPSLYGLPHDVGDEVSWHALSSLCTNMAVTKSLAGGGVVLDVVGVEDPCGESVCALCV